MEEEKLKEKVAEGESPPAVEMADRSTQEFFAKPKFSIYTWLSAFILTFAGILETWIQWTSMQLANAYIANATANVVLIGGAVKPTYNAGWPWVGLSIVMVIVGVAFVIHLAHRQFS